MKGKNSHQKNGSIPSTLNLDDDGTSHDLLNDVCQMIESTKERIAQDFSSEITVLYWHIGRRIKKGLMNEERGEYGKRIVEYLSHELTVEFGKGFSRRNLFNMVRFAEVFQEMEIVQTLSAQLSWSHIIEILRIENALAREFYTEMCRLERWTVRVLRDKIQGMLFERTAISKKPEKLALEELKLLREQDRMSPDLVFRDPYLLDFLGLSELNTERDLEAAILRELESFILELGTDFSFVSRQKRLSIGKEDFHLDLLFFHRSLRRLVAIELKLGKFTAAFKGQMELYLRWLDKYERKAGEEPPIGILFCSEKDTEQIELLQLDDGEMRVAEYLTKLPPRREFQVKLHKAIMIGREKVSFSANER